MNRKIIGLLAMAVLYGIALAPVHAGPAMPKPMVAQKPAKTEPAVTLADAGGRHALASYKGHYVLLNMWATWCIPCVAELPALTRLKAAVPDMTVLAVDLTGRKETPAMAEAFLKEHRAAALGAHVDTLTMFMRGFTVAVMPTTVLIDPKGKVIARAEGPAEWASAASIAYLKSLK